MKRILLLQLRPEDAVADNEYESVVAAGAVPELIHRVRMERDGVPAVALDDYAAVIVGGEPSNVSDPAHKQPAHQRSYEPQLFDLVANVVARDMPYLGICYGMGVLTAQQGGAVSHRYAEGVGAVTIDTTPHGAKDHLIADVVPRFKAYVGHKEAVETLPAHATLPATSLACPVQMYRIGRHVYATQFHPELDLDSLALRIRAYKHLGYFQPDEAESLIQEAAQHDVSAAGTILRRFVKHYT